MNLGIGSRQARYRPAVRLTRLQALIGTVEQIVEGLQARREIYGISYVIVFARSMESFAPVVAHPAGT